MLFFRESETEYLDHPSKAMDSAQKDSNKNEKEGLQNRSKSTTYCIVIISILKVTHAHYFQEVTPYLTLLLEILFIFYQINVQ